MNVSVSEAGAVLSGTPPTTVTFAAGSAEATLSVTLEDDEVLEADALVTATVSTGSGYTVDADAGSAQVEVFDNDSTTTTTTAETLWTSTLVWTDLGGGWLIAYAEDFSNPTWSEDGHEYRIWYVAYDTVGGDFWLRLSAGLPTGGIPEPSELTLQVGDETVGPASVVAAFARGDIAIATGVEQSWQVGERVEVRLTRGTEAGESATSEPGLSVADAQAQEAEGAVLSFRATLDAAQSSAVTARYATGDITATAGADYEAVVGVLRFEPGETAKTVSVPVLNDSHDEGSETLRFVVFRPFGVEIVDGMAVGTIVNTGPIPQAWLARFGRAAAEHVLEGVEERFSAPRDAGMRITLAGHSVSDEGGVRDAFAENAADGEALSGALGSLFNGIGEKPSDRTHPGGLQVDRSDDFGEAGRLREFDARSETVGMETRSVTGRELLAGTSLYLGSELAGGGVAALWGRGAISSFNGHEDGLSLDGDVSTSTLGADYAVGPWIAGMALSHSRGAGEWRQGDIGGAIESTVTGLYPYAGYDVSERLSVWAVAGFGSGTLTLTPRDQAPIETGLGLEMAAAGARGELLSRADGDGFDLALKTDALGVRTTSDSTEGPGGLLKEATASVTRLRLALEGASETTFDSGSTLRPSIEAALRHDGGDAESGFGLELAGGLAFTDSTGSFSAEVAAHALLSHEDDDFRDRGVSGALRYDPQPFSELGLSLSLTPSWGTSAHGANGIWERATSPDLLGAGLGDDDSLSQHGRLEGEIGYGIPVLGGRAIGTPWVRVGLTETDGHYQLGYGLHAGRSVVGIESGQFENGQDIRLTYGYEISGGRGHAFRLGVEATRRESAYGDEADRMVGVRADLRW